jgi:hypothetical protein
VKHLEENNETYFSHLKFATTIGLTLMFRGGIFFLHGFFPVREVPKKLNLKNTCDKLNQWNDYADRRNEKEVM